MYCKVYSKWFHNDLTIELLFIGSYSKECFFVPCLVYRSKVRLDVIRFLSIVRLLDVRSVYGSFVLRLDDNVRSFVRHLGRSFVRLDVVWAIICSFGRRLGDRLFVLSLK